MTQEEKQLLLQDLCARLPYGVKVKANLFNNGDVETVGTLKTINLKKDWFEFEGIITPFHLEELKPYLRPMSSMTKEEYDQLYIDSRIKEDSIDILDALANDMDAIDWLNKNHFDYRGLIDKGLAIKVTKNNNPYE